MGSIDQLAIKVSIIVPTYNRALFIKETLNSISNQSYPYWECIVIDDGSTDGTQHIVSSFANEESRVKLFLRDREPKGAPTCRNIGLAKSTSDFVMFLDSDDLLGSYCLEQRIAYITLGATRDFWVFPMLLFHKKIDDIKLYTNLPNKESDLCRFLRSDLPWSISCVVWKKTFLQGLRGFDESYPNCQDHDLHLRALWQTQNYATFPYAVPDNFYRQHSEEKIYDPNDKKRILIGARMLITRHTYFINKSSYDEEKNYFKPNILIYFKYLIKEHLFINDYRNAYELTEFMVNNKILNRLWAFVFRIYIYLASMKFYRIKGFYRIWDVIFHQYRARSKWGKIPFQGVLQYNSKTNNEY